jgi:tRNA-uridine 2-sulfurtransferase
MSGGVDSSVAAALLVEQGYDVIGMMMRLWSEPSCDGAAPANRCCTPDQMADARRVAGLLGIPFYVVDVQDHFRQTIVQFFIDEHENGRTPNPCIECNRQIRFTYLLERALALDADYLATGHYAQVRHTPDGYQLLKGLDPNKDQSYVLHVLDQEKLGQVLFPIGGYTKPEVRELAQKFGLPVASKSESQDLCFLGDGDYRRFLQEYSQQPSQSGPILTSSGQALGQHEGLPFYTIGQRKGLGISANEPLFVLRKDVARNALIVGSIRAKSAWGAVSLPTPVTFKSAQRQRSKEHLIHSPKRNLPYDQYRCRPDFGFSTGHGLWRRLPSFSGWTGTPHRRFSGCRLDRLCRGPDYWRPAADQLAKTGRRPLAGRQCWQLDGHHSKLVVESR